MELMWGWGDDRTALCHMRATIIIIIIIHSTHATRIGYGGVPFYYGPFSKIIYFQTHLD